MTTKTFLNNDDDDDDVFGFDNDNDLSEELLNDE